MHAAMMRDGARACRAPEPITGLLGDRSAGQVIDASSDPQIVDENRRAVAVRGHRVLDVPVGVLEVTAVKRSRFLSGVMLTLHARIDVSVGLEVWCGEANLLTDRINEERGNAIGNLVRPVRLDFRDRVIRWPAMMRRLL